MDIKYIKWIFIFNFIRAFFKSDTIKPVSTTVAKVHNVWLWTVFKGYQKLSILLHILINFKICKKIVLCIHVSIFPIPFYASNENYNIKIYIYEIPWAK